MTGWPVPSSHPMAQIGSCFSTRQTSHVALPCGQCNRRKPTPAQRRIPLLPLPQALHSYPQGPAGESWRGRTDGIAEPRPCAMNRGIKIIPDLALRDWPRGLQFCPEPHPKATRWPAQGNSGPENILLHPRARGCWLLRNFQKNQECMDLCYNLSKNQNNILF